MQGDNPAAFARRHIVQRGAFERNVGGAMTVPAPKAVTMTRFAAEADPLAVPPAPSPTQSRSLAVPGALVPFGRRGHVDRGVLGRGARRLLVPIMTTAPVPARSASSPQTTKHAARFLYEVARANPVRCATTTILWVSDWAL